MNLSQKQAVSGGLAVFFAVIAIGFAALPYLLYKKEPVEGSLSNPNGNFEASFERNLKIAQFFNPDGSFAVDPSSLDLDKVEKVEMPDGTVKYFPLAPKPNTQALGLFFEDAGGLKYEGKRTGIVTSVDFGSNYSSEVEVSRAYRLLKGVKHDGSLYVAHNSAQEAVIQLKSVPNSSNNILELKTATYVDQNGCSEVHYRIGESGEQIVEAKNCVTSMSIESAFQGMKLISIGE